VTLAAGSRLGPYEILAPLGAGGMGEVYKARDTRLGREVAIKVLPSHLSDDPDLKARFEREARAISQLTHPHICTLHDIGSENGVDFLVMELLDGQSLADRLEKGALPTEQVLKFGVEIADALDRAHRAGIVHRDLKPGNIMLTKSGVKLLDFGLAKMAAADRAPSDLSSLPTELSPSRPLTEKGTVMGTFQYMAPEQLEGKDADARTDIFSFGCVLYEMATGKKAFTGLSQASLVTSIMSKEPEPISAVAPMAPPALDRLVRTCLAKDAEDRWQSARDVRNELVWIAQAGSQAGVAAPVAARRKSRERLAWLFAAAAGVAALAVAAAYLRLAFVPLRVLQASILPPEKSTFSFAGDNAGPPTLSPDGKNLAFVAAGEGRPMLYVRALDSVKATPLPGTEGAVFPFWSPDGRSLGFFADKKLKRIEVSAGGTAATICDAPNARGGAWNRDGVILFTPETRQAIFRVSASGGAPEQVTKIDPASHTTHRWPVFLPDGKHFLYFAGTHNDVRGEKAAIYFASIDGKENRRLVHTLAGALYSSGYLLYLRENTLLAQPMDPSTGRLLGDPAPAAEGVQFDLSTWHGAFTVSDGNVLAFQSGGTGNASALVWFDRSGKVLGTLGERDNFYGPVRISPDGKRVAAAIGDPGDLFVFDVGSGLKTRLTFSPASYVTGSWSPDGRQLLFSSTRSKNGRFSMFVKPSSGASPEQSVQTPPEQGGQIANDWSRDGRFICYQENVTSRESHEWLLSWGAGQKPRELLTQHDGNENEAAFSPDSRWVAYQVFSSGAPTIFVTAVEGAGGKWQISTAGGYHSRWRDDGREIYYIAPDLTLMAADVDGTGSEFRVGAVKPLFRTHAVSNPLYSFDTRDGQRFLVNSLDAEASAPITLVINWQAGMKK
jgi:Tol biopolymer transport system component/predicted Ser/Thr protein kinase